MRFSAAWNHAQTIARPGGERASDEENRDAMALSPGPAKVQPFPLLHITKTRYWTRYWPRYSTSGCLNQPARAPVGRAEQQNPSFEAFRHMFGSERSLPNPGLAQRASRPLPPGAAIWGALPQVEGHLPIWMGSVDPAFRGMRRVRIYYRPIVL